MSYLTEMLKGIEVVILSEVALTVKLTVTGCGVLLGGVSLEPEPHPAANKSSAANPNATWARR